MNRRLQRLRRKLTLALAGLVGGFAIACSPKTPGEAPPMAPRPEPVAPATRDEPPVPGAPDPMAPKFPPDDANAPGAPPPIVVDPGFVDDRGEAPDPLQLQPSDAGAGDAGVPPLPPLRDSGVPADAAMPVSDGGVGGRDGGVPGDGGVAPDAGTARPRR